MEIIIIIWFKKTFCLLFIGQFVYFEQQWNSVKTKPGIFVDDGTGSMWTLGSTTDAKVGFGGRRCNGYLTDGTRLSVDVKAGIG